MRRFLGRTKIVRGCKSWRSLRLFGRAEQAELHTYEQIDNFSVESKGSADLHVIVIVDAKSLFGLLVESKIASCSPRLLLAAVLLCLCFAKSMWRTYQLRLTIASFVSVLSRRDLDLLLVTKYDESSR